MDFIKVEKANPLTFHYKTRFVKECTVKQFNSPHRDVKEAELDIQDAIKAFDFLDRLEMGESNVNFMVQYIPNPDGTYSPRFYQLEIEKSENRPIRFEDCSFWALFKLWYKAKRLKLQRNK